MKKILSVLLTLALILSTICIGFSFTASAATTTHKVEFSDSTGVKALWSTHAWVESGTDGGVLVSKEGNHWGNVKLPIELDPDATYTYEVKYRTVTTGGSISYCLKLSACNENAGKPSEGKTLVGWASSEVTDYTTLTGSFTLSDLGYTTDYPYLGINSYNDGVKIYIDYVQVTATTPDVVIPTEGKVDFATNNGVKISWQGCQWVDSTIDGGVLVYGAANNWGSVKLPIELDPDAEYNYEVKYRAVAKTASVSNYAIALCATNENAGKPGNGKNISGWTNATSDNYTSLKGTFTPSDLGYTADFPYLGVNAWLDSSVNIYIDSVEIKYDNGLEGSGTEADPYKISTADELRNFATTYAAGGSKNSEGLYFELANDIYINDTTDPEWMLNDPTPWVYVSNAEVATNVAQGFRGHFDGNGYTVYGMYYGYAGDMSTQGLIPVTSGNAVVTNVNVRHAYAENPNNLSFYLGGIVGVVNKNTDGTASNVTISKCVVDDTVDFSSIGWGYIGGIVGGVLSSKATIEYCGVTMATNNEGSVAQRGGYIVGGPQWTNPVSITIKNSYAKGALTNGDRATAQALITTENFYAGHNWYAGGTLAINSVSAADMLGGAALVSMPNLGWDVWQANDSAYPTIKGSTAFVPTESDDTDELDVWDGTVAVNYAGGTGAVNDPYLISTPEQLRKMVTTNEDGKYYILTNNIYLNDVEYYASWGTEAPKNNWWNWSLNNTASLAVNLDGNGYTIYGLYSVTESPTGTGNQYAGLFANIGANSKIENLHIRKAYIAGVYTGAFVGSVCGTSGTEGTFTLSGCSVNNSVTISGKSGGGLIGLPIATVTVENCYSAANLSATTYIGGIYGDVWGSKAKLTFINCYTDGWEPLARTRDSGNARTPGGSLSCTNVYYINHNHDNGGWGNITMVTSFADMDLPDTYWYGTDAKYLKNRGARIFDINMDDSDAPNAGDLAALAQGLLEGTTSVLCDCNADEAVNILDLVCLKKNISFF
ncbi:MAG: hypothetical protein IKD04_09475 [Clostridia bacterium]|nr:hypothetical protein [Clostridia bacterium]